jgi:ribulose-phosphate 3-epimerase
MMSKNVSVVPAILTEDPTTLEKMLRQVESFTDYVQIDIMDGEFVPSKSISWKHIADLFVKLKWEAHLMVAHPGEYIESFKQAGADRIIFHYESVGSAQQLISRIRDLGLKVGLAINPDTSVPAIASCINEIDSVLLLTVTPGFYGSKFIPEVMDKVVEIRHIRPEIEIGVDGGVKEGNIKEIASAGVDYICVGSAIFLQPDPAASYRHLQSLIQ